MGYSVRTFAQPGKFCRQLTVAALAQAIPQETITAVLHETGAGAQRERKLTMPLVIWALIAMNLYTALSMGHVLQKVVQGLRYAWPGEPERVPRANALSYRRYQLGVRPLVALFQRVCRPLATPATPGACLFGRRLLALDGTMEDVPDTPANARAFGRQSGKRGSAAFPQVLGVYLVECGTHAIVDAGFWPCHTGEQVGARRLLRSVGPESLLLWDCNFHSYALLRAAQQRGAQVLGRLPSGNRPTFVRALPDGSLLVALHPGTRRRRDPADALLVRLVTYTLTDPARPGYGATHRLVTTLLDPATAPALDLICAYHERWEIEVTIDETQTHQRLAYHPLRSRLPVGVLQELYALLLAHYAVRALMLAAADRVGLDPDRLSFIAAVRLIQDAIPEFQQTALADHPRLLARLLADIAAARLPPRRARSNPRVRKRTGSKFHRKRPDHLARPPLAGSFRDAIRLI